ncbi:MAG: glutamate--tRNA ligase [Gammaproteobacteria bacterium]|nr:glutamate--tRNA ligase [Gammaproteobacteria bacterium]
MPPALVKTRFAPSPTGHIHMGNTRVALFSALYARHRRGVFLLRIEDTDLERSAARYIETLKEDLRWLGLAWQEGPEAGGPHGPYHQSQRLDIYQHYFDELQQRDRAYPCFCSARELALSRKAQLTGGRPPRYAGTCARLSTAEIQSRLEQGLQPTLRFRIPAGVTVRFEDLVRGPQSFASDDIGDFIIRRADGTPAFFFSNAVDDALMGVTHVLRGEDHLSNTPRQMLLLQALQLNIPHYAHLSMIVGPDGAPLSKRHGSRSVRELRESGYLSEAVINYLARLGHHYESNELLSLEQLAAGFDLVHLGRSPVRFDNAQLQHWQQLALARADVDELWAWMGCKVHEKVPQAQRIAFVQAVRHNITLPEHAGLWARILFDDHLELSQTAREAMAQAGREFFQHAAAAHKQHPDDFKALANEIKTRTGKSGKSLYQPLRAALTGELDGPEMVQLLPLLGAERTGRRLHAGVQ